MKYVKLFENSEKTDWNNSFRTLAKLGAPITKDQYIYWNEDIANNEVSWEAIAEFFVKEETIVHRKKLLKEFGEDTDQDIFDLIEVGVLNWSDVTQYFNIEIMVLDPENFPFQVHRDRQLMDFYDYRIVGGITESKNKKIIYDKDYMTIVAAKVNDVPLCSVSFQDYLGGSPAIFFPSNFEKYLK